MAAAGIARPLGGGTESLRSVGHASAPWFDPAAVPHVVVAAPLVAARRGVYPGDRISDPFPTRGLSAAPRAGPATGEASSPIVVAGAALVLLAFAAAAVLRWWRERRELRRLVTALAREEC